jgi:hypothetical protein
MTTNQPDLQQRWFIVDYVLAAVDHPEDAKKAVETLQSAGFHAESIQQLPGDEAVEQVDTKCEHCGIIKRIARILWSYISIQGVHLQELEKQGQWGSQILAIHVRDRDEAQLASQILRDHYAHHVQHFGPYGDVIETAP